MPDDSWGGGVPKAVTSDKGGEISCSVDETNRIRAELGLKPLNVGGKSKEQEEVDNFKQTRDAEEAERRQAEVLIKIEKARKKRLLHAKIAGKSIAESAKEEEDIDDTAAWIERSRKKAKEKVAEDKLLAIKRKLEEEEEEEAYTGSDLGGMKVAHGTGSFLEGNDVILTLKDTSVLTENGKGLEDSDDELENVNLKDDDRRREREDKIKEVRKGAYQGVDDDEFEPGGKKKDILSHYDEKEVRDSFLRDSEHLRVHCHLTRTRLLPATAFPVCSPPRPTGAGGEQGHRAGSLGRPRPGERHSNSCERPGLTARDSVLGALAAPSTRLPAPTTTASACPDPSRSFQARKNRKKAMH